MAISQIGTLEQLILISHFKAGITKHYSNPCPQSSPRPGTYLVELTGYDVDNGVTYPTNLTLEVPALADVDVSFDYASFPVHPVENSVIRLDLQI